MALSVVLLKSNVSNILLFNFYEQKFVQHGAITIVTKRVTVWYGFWSRGIIEPFFFENVEGEAVIVNDNRYRAMLNEFLFIKIKEEDIGNIWLQQNGATCHTAETTLDVLRSVFEDRIISRRANVA